MTVQLKLHNQNSYVDAVIALYLKLPDTPVKPSYNDRLTATGFFAQAIPLQTIETALLLASLRRLYRQDNQPPLSPVRSLAYFAPVVHEVISSNLNDDYLQYLRLKIRSFAST